MTTTLLTVIKQRRLVIAFKSRWTIKLSLLAPLKENTKSKTVNCFVNSLAGILEENGFRVILFPSGADAIIAKTALDIQTKPVTVLADDTDVLCLLLHHVYFSEYDHDIYLKNMRLQSTKDERICYSIRDIIDANEKENLDHLLFAHAFTGSDTTSQIHNFGKKSIFSKLKKSFDLQQLSKQFYSDEMDVNTIGNSAIRCFELIHSTSSTLQQIRKQKYDLMVVSDRSKIDPALLPPSPRAAFYHGLRVYHQVTVLKNLSDSDIDPLRWGWKLTNNIYTPIMTDIDAGPPELLKIICCAYKGPCGAKCSCRKSGLECTSTCKDCHGITCTHAPVIEPEADRNFLDVFDSFMD